MRPRAHLCTGPSPCHRQIRSCAKGPSGLGDLLVLRSMSTDRHHALLGYTGTRVGEYDWLRARYSTTVTVSRRWQGASCMVLGDGVLGLTRRAVPTPTPASHGRPGGTARLGVRWREVGGALSCPTLVRSHGVGQYLPARLAVVH